MINAGSIAVAVLAIVADYAFRLIENRMVSKGLRIE
jgi:hypothetical protein